MRHALEGAAAEGQAVVVKVRSALVAEEQILQLLGGGGGGGTACYKSCVEKKEKEGRGNGDTETGQGRLALIMDVWH